MGELVLKPLILEWITQWYRLPELGDKIAKSWEVAFSPFKLVVDPPGPPVVLHVGAQPASLGVPPVEAEEESDDDVEVDLGSSTGPLAVAVAATNVMVDAQSDDNDDREEQVQQDEALARALARGTRVRPVRRATQA